MTDINPDTTLYRRSQLYKLKYTNHNKIKRIVYDENSSYPYKLITRNDYLTILILIMFTAILMIIKNISYYPATVIGNTLYSKVTAYALSSRKIPYKYCKSKWQCSYHKISNRKLVNFYGPCDIDYISKEIVPVIKLDKEKKVNLERHTSLVLENREMRQMCWHDLLKNIKNDVPVKIKRLGRNLWYITDNNVSWFTKFIFTDEVKLLDRDECVSSILLSKHLEDKTNGIKDVESNGRLIRSDRYRIENDLLIEINHKDDDNEESQIYSLDVPRPFKNKDGFYVIHPFHIPEVWDIFYTILILMDSIIKMENL